MLMEGYIERHQIKFVLEELSVRRVINQDPCTAWFRFLSLLESNEHDNRCILLINDQSVQLIQQIQLLCMIGFLSIKILLFILYSKTQISENF